MAEKPAARAVTEFINRYGRDPAGLAFAPGRVNIIGEHTDYNGGLVLPAAVDLATYIAFAPRADSTVRIYSETAGEEAVFELEPGAGEALAFWARYAWGTGMALLEGGVRAAPFDACAVSTVPLGGGLSSSASFEVALALAYLGAQAEQVDRMDLVGLCRRAENHFVGVNCGVMDQFSSVFGAEGRALFLDCRSLESRLVPFPPASVLVVADTTVRHALGEETEGYHKRQRECREAVAVLARHQEGVASLRDANLEMLDARREALGEVLYRRARHVVTENERVTKAAAAMEAGDVAQIGRLITGSHESLKSDFEVSCRELDLMVGAAEGLPGHHGTRMVGGGFGGCTVSLVDEAEGESFAAAVAGRYREAAGLDAVTYIVRPGNGAALLGV